MYRVIIKHTRPSQSVEFFNPKTSTLVSDETRAHIRNNYVVTGKIVNSEESISPDGLDLTIAVVYQDEATYDAWKSDTVIVEGVYNIGVAHRESNGITSVVISAEAI